VLNTTRVGNHPEMIRLFHKIAVAIGEDSLTGTSGSTTSPEDAQAAALKQMYPTMHKDSAA
jgi:hypothetical protein